MVESIFGGKTTYPLGCRNVFHPRLVERRLSVQSTHLKTISENDDDNATSYADDTSNVQEFQNDAEEGPICYRRPRTMSLPAIYRDGSYLRIKRSTPMSCQKRRYSEPAGLATQQIIHRLSMRSNDSSSVSDESENGSCIRPSIQNIEWREIGGCQDLSTPRRHSDPMCYATEHVKKLGISMERRGKSSRKVFPGVTVLAVHSNKPQLRTDNEHGQRTPRRRKSSLVPVPFSSPITDTRTARNNTCCSRPMSFPPSKRESKHHCALPPLKPGTCLTSHVPSESDNIAVDWDYNNNNGVEENMLESDESNDLDDKYAANEDILVQWMKFFG